MSHEVERVSIFGGSRDGADWVCAAPESIAGSRLPADEAVNSTALCGAGKP